MAIHLWTVVCERYSVAPVENTLSLTNIVEQVQIGLQVGPRPAEPILIAVPWSIVSVWARERPGAGEITQVRFVITSPIGNRLGEGLATLDLMQGSRSRIFAPVGQFSIDRSGEYVYSIEQQTAGEWREAARLLIEVTFTHNGERIE